MLKDYRGLSLLTLVVAGVGLIIGEKVFKAGYKQGFSDCTTEVSKILLTTWKNQLDKDKESKEEKTE